MTTRRNHASHFEKHKTAFEEGGGRDDAYIEEEQDPRSTRDVEEEKGFGV